MLKKNLGELRFADKDLNINDVRQHSDTCPVKMNQKMSFFVLEMDFFFGVINFSLG